MGGGEGISEFFIEINSHACYSLRACMCAFEDSQNTLRRTRLDDLGAFTVMPGSVTLQIILLFIF